MEATKCFRSDNDGEYSYIDFEEYCRKNGIRHEKIIFYTPQHNEVAKRMNWTLTERVRSVLSLAKLIKSFWDEALCID